MNSPDPSKKKEFDPKKYRKLTPYERCDRKTQFSIFLEDYFQLDPKAMLFATLKGYSEPFIPASSLLPIPKPLSSLYNKELTTLPYEELKKYCEELFPTIRVTEAESNAVEYLTRKQSQSSVWFDHRIGRITASVAKSALATPINAPSKTVVLKMCEPNAEFHSKPTE